MNKYVSKTENNSVSITKNWGMYKKIELSTYLCQYELLLTPKKIVKYENELLICQLNFFMHILINAIA